MVKSGKYFLYLNFRPDCQLARSQFSINLMLNLIGTYECKADVKGRLMMPSPLKKQLAPVSANGFVIKRAVFQPCLELYPMNEWNALMEKMSKLNRFSRKNNDFIRRFTAGVKTVELDAAGRLLIPKDLQSFAGIAKEVVVSSAIDIVEIWDKSKYERAINDAATDFADLAEEVMGDSDSDNGIS
ncbi:MAG: MraZ protein [Patiriisocius sp.]